MKFPEKSRKTQKNKKKIVRKVPLKTKRSGKFSKKRKPIKLFKKKGEKAEDIHSKHDESVVAVEDDYDLVDEFQNFLNEAAEADAEGYFPEFVVVRTATEILSYFLIEENDGAGDCLFLSLLHYMQNENYDPCPRSAMEVRFLIIKYVLENWMEYAHFFTNYSEEFEEYQCGDYYNIDTCQEIYETYMSGEGTFGTQLELAAACHLFEFRCSYITNEGEDVFTIQSMNEDFDTDRSICHLMFTGDFDSGHYRFLKIIPPTNPTNILPSGTYLPRQYRTDFKDVYTLTLIE